MIRPVSKQSDKSWLTQRNVINNHKSRVRTCRNRASIKVLTGCLSKFNVQERMSSKEYERYKEHLGLAKLGLVRGLPQHNVSYIFQKDSHPKVGRILQAGKHCEQHVLVTSHRIQRTHTYALLYIEKLPEQSSRAIYFTNTLSSYNLFSMNIDESNSLKTIARHSS